MGEQVAYKLQHTSFVFLIYSVDVVITDRQHGQKNLTENLQNYIVLYSKQILNLHHVSIKCKPQPYTLVCSVEGLRYDENGNKKSF